MDSHVRTATKTVTCATLAVIFTMALAWIITRQVGFTTSIGVLDALIQLGSYYLHERAWDRVGFGRREQGARFQGKEKKEWDSSL